MTIMTRLTDKTLLNKYPNFANLVQHLYAFCLTEDNISRPFYEDHLQHLLHKGEQSSRDWTNVRLYYMMLADWLMDHWHVLDGRFPMDLVSFDGMDNVKEILLLKEKLLASSEHFMEDMSKYMDDLIDAACDQMIDFASSLMIFPPSTLSMLTKTSKLTQLPILISAMQASIEDEQSQIRSTLTHFMDDVFAYVQKVIGHMTDLQTRSQEASIREKLEQSSIYHLYLVNLLNSLLHKLRVIRAEAMHRVFDQTQVTRLVSIRNQLESEQHQLDQTDEQLKAALEPYYALGSDFIDIAREYSNILTETDLLEQELFEHGRHQFK